MPGHPEPRHAPALSPPLSPSTRLLLIGSGALWGLWYVGMDRIGWGEPGSLAYARYELYNRVLPLLLLALTAGLLRARPALRVAAGRGAAHGIHLACAGLAVMAAGSVLEFWWLTLAPYAPGSLRDVGWIVYCSGLLGFFLGAARLAAALRRSPGARLAAALLAAPLPAALAAVGLNRLLPADLPPLTLAVALSGLGIAVLGARLPRPAPLRVRG